jgi:steroid 5-alpha reductase family enzyme
VRPQTALFQTLQKRVRGGHADDALLLLIFLAATRLVNEIVLSSKYYFVSSVVLACVLSDFVWGAGVAAFGGILLLIKEGVTIVLYVLLK